MRLSIGFVLLVGMQSGCSVYHKLIPIDGGTDMSCGDACTTPDMLPCSGNCGDMAPKCTSSSTCPSTAPVCEASGVCGACESSVAGGVSTECSTYHASGNPSTPLCGPAGACVQCLSKDDCATFNQTCNLTTNECGPCATNSDCSTGVCASAGACAPATDVFYVDNRGAATVAACKAAHLTADGTSWANAFCDISDATGATTKRPYIVVRGSATAYGALSFTTTATQTIIGPGHEASPTALVFTPTLSPAVSVSPAAGQTVTLTLDGLELSGSSGTGNQRAGVSCSGTAGTAALTIKNSRLDNSGSSGLDSTACTVTLDANVISTNSGGGISLASGSFVVSNNLIVANGNAGPGVVLSGNFTSTLWWFNTVAGNLRSGAQAGAFSCGGVLSGAPAIEASIVWGNTSAGGSSIGTGCTFTYSDVDDTMLPAGAGNFNSDPKFVDAAASNYRIQTGSPCANKVTSATGLAGGALPNHDVDGKARPRAATSGYDCGAAQAP